MKMKQTMCLPAEQMQWLWNTEDTVISINNDESVTIVWYMNETQT